MSEVKQAWSDVGDAFEALALKLKYHAEESAGVSGSQVREALHNLGERVRQSMDALSDAVNDPAVRQDARRIGTALSEAVAATLADAGEEVRDAFSRTDQNPGKA